jgi:hypothetical protein
MEMGKGGTKYHRVIVESNLAHTQDGQAFL